MKFRFHIYCHCWLSLPGLLSKRIIRHEFSTNSLNGLTLSLVIAKMFSSFTRQVLQTLQKPLQRFDSMARGFCTNTATVNNKRTQASTYQMSSFPFLVSSLFQKNVFYNSSNVQSIRNHVRMHYKPRAWKRYNKHNIEKRLLTDGGIEVLWRRVLKGKHNLAVYERILPNTVDGKILAKHQTRFKKHPLTKQKLPKPGLY